MDAKAYTSFENYQKDLKAEWRRLGQDSIKALINDMDKRLDKVIEAGGGSIDR